MGWAWQSRSKHNLEGRIYFKKGNGGQGESFIDGGWQNHGNTAKTQFWLPAKTKAKLRCWYKRKRFIQVPGRMADSHLKGYLPFLLKPTVLIKIGRGGLYFYPIILLSLVAQALPICFSSPWPAHCKNLPLCYLDSLTMISRFLVRGCCRTGCQKAWSCHNPQSATQR